jgi:DsbC/DsbD-like thiol-disulfide interchange protein
MLSPLFWPLLLLLQSTSRADDTLPPPVTLQAFTDQAATAPGEGFQLLVLLDVPEGWHIYWENPGDSGEATRLELRSDLDLQAQGPRWTAPEERLVLPGDVVNLAYTHQAAALYSLQTPDDAQGLLGLEIEAHYLICKHKCAPGTVSTKLLLPVEDQSHPSPQAARIAQWTTRLPRPLPETSRWEWTEDRLRLWISEPAEPELFPSLALDAALLDLSWHSDGDRTAIAFALRPESPRPLEGSVLRITHADGRRVDYLLDIPPNPDP